MDCTSFLRSLPFLHPIPANPTTKVWRYHRDEIIDYINSTSSASSKFENTGHCLFQNHVVSIEPKTVRHEHGMNKPKPAFFKPPKSQNDQSDCQVEDHDENSGPNPIGDDAISTVDNTPYSKTEMSKRKLYDDPALVCFRVFLLPVEFDCVKKTKPSVVKFAKDNTGRIDEQTSITSPAMSTASASTSMSTSQSPKIQVKQNRNSGGKSDDNFDMSKTFLLYFYFEYNDRGDFDIFCVDYCSIKSMDIRASSKQAATAENNDRKDSKKSNSDTKDECVASKSRLEKPMSLLMNFGLCSFRIFGKECLPLLFHKDNDKPLDVSVTTTYQQNLQNDALMLRNNILSYHKNFAWLKTTFYGSVHRMKYPENLIPSSSSAPQSDSTHHENAQIEEKLLIAIDEVEIANSIKSKMVENSNESNAKHTDCDTDMTLSKEVGLKKSSESLSTTQIVYTTSEEINMEHKRKHKSYKRSWNAMQKMHSIINSQKRSYNGLLDERFCALAESCATELANSYVMDGHVEKGIFTKNLCEKELRSKRLESRRSINETLGQLFRAPAKTRSSKRIKGKEDAKRDIREMVHEAELHLHQYRETRAAQHRMAFLIPRR